MRLFYSKIPIVIKLFYSGISIHIKFYQILNQLNAETIFKNNLGLTVKKVEVETSF